MADGAPATEIERAATFRRALRRFLARTAEATGAVGLSPQRYDLLLILKAAVLRGEAPTVGTLAAELHMRQTAVTELLKRAEADGLVRRSRSREDGRAVVVTLTPDGERRLLRAFRDLHEDREELARAFAEVQARFRAIARRRG